MRHLASVFGGLLQLAPLFWGEHVGVDEGGAAGARHRITPSTIAGDQVWLGHDVELEECWSYQGVIQGHAGIGGQCSAGGRVACRCCVSVPESEE